MKPVNWIEGFANHIPATDVTKDAWDITNHSIAIIDQMIKNLPGTYDIDHGWAIHPSATIEDGATIKPPVIIGPDCLVASNAYLRGGVFMAEKTVIGPSCEVKSTFLFTHSKIAHLSFVGDSIIGNNVNIEAGVVVANHRNELEDKTITILYNEDITHTGTTKFGALIADDVKIGANTVIAPGTLLPMGTIIDRLAHIDQSKG